MTDTPTAPTLRELLRDSVERVVIHKKNPMESTFFSQSVVYLGQRNTEWPGGVGTPRTVTREVSSPMCAKRITPPFPDPNPSGLCMCGCGEPTSVITRKDVSHKRYTGHHASFIPGHHFKDQSKQTYKIEDRGYTTPCWIWQSFLTKGYGSIREHGKRFKIHRVFYERYVGQIPEGLVLDHLCRQPACCNPSHLESVTMKVNMQRGCNTILTPDKVLEIRSLHNVLHSKDVGKMFGVASTTILEVWKGSTWSNIQSDEEKDAKS